MTETAKKVYPYLSFRFRVEIEQLEIAQVSEVTGLQFETETEPYEEGGVNDYVHQLPKKTKYPRIILKRGITDLDDLWKWYQEVVSGTFVRKNISVILMDVTGNDKWRWNFSQAYPVKWTGPELKGESNTVAFESIELVHNGMKKG
jgi:phage tail-like protein